MEITAFALNEAPPVKAAIMGRDETCVRGSLTRVGHPVVAVATTDAQPDAVGGHHQGPPLRQVPERGDHPRAASKRLRLARDDRDQAAHWFLPTAALRVSAAAFHSAPRATRSASRRAPSSAPSASAPPTAVVSHAPAVGARVLRRVAEVLSQHCVAPRSRAGAPGRAPHSPRREACQDVS